MRYFDLWGVFAGAVSFVSLFGNIAAAVSVVYLALTVPKYLREIDQRLARIENRAEREHSPER